MRFSLCCIVASRFRIRRKRCSRCVKYQMNDSHSCGYVEHEQEGDTRSGYGKGFASTNLKCMHQFYLSFPICHLLRGELTGTHYRMWLKVRNQRVRDFSEDECAKSGRSSRQLKRQLLLL